MSATESSATQPILRNEQPKNEPQRRVAASQLTDRPNKRRAGAAAGGLAVAESRPQVVDGLLRGARCTRCAHALAQPDAPWCAACFGPITAHGFTPTGTVWAATKVSIPVGRWEPPFALAYVDVDDGPRVLVHVKAQPRPRVGDRVTFTTDAGGDLIAVDLIAADTTQEKP